MSFYRGGLFFFFFFLSSEQAPRKWGYYPLIKHKSLVVNMKNIPKNNFHLGKKKITNSPFH